MHIVNSPVVKSLKERTNFPVDHIARGLHAGAAEVIFKCSMDAVETKCQAMGDQYCEFILKPTEEWKADKTYKNQLFEK